MTALCASLPLLRDSGSRHVLRDAATLTSLQALTPAAAPQVNPAQLAAECMARGVKVHPGHLCGSAGPGSRIRLCFSFYSPEELDLGAQRLAACLAEHTPLEPS
jgi:DNA-binding transcriptional MocR family regulator